MDDAGQHCCHSQPGGQALAQGGILRQNVQRHIKGAQIGPQKGGSQLLSGSDLGSEHRQTLGAGMVGGTDRLVDGRRFPPGPQGHQLI